MSAPADGEAGPEGEGDAETEGEDSPETGAVGRDGATPESDAGEADHGSWTFALEDVDEDGVVRPDIEPGSVDPEHAAFVLAGVVGAVLLLLTAL